jgi:hypothetical protein
MLNKLGGYALGTCVAIAFLALPIVFLMGAVWSSVHLLPLLIDMGWWVLGITVFIALPLAISRKMRGPVAPAIMYSSFFYGVTAWLIGFLLTYTHWGIFAVILGLFIIGIGVVPIGLLASAFHGWDGFFPLLALVILTFGSRIVAIALASSADKNSRDWESEPESALMEHARAIAESEARIELADSEGKS